MDIIFFFLALPGAWMVLQTFSSFCYASENFLDEWLLNRLSASDTLVEEEESEEVEPVGILVLVSAFFGIVIAAVFGLVAYFTPNANITLNVGNELIFQAVLIGMLEIVWLVPYLHATNHAGAVKAAPLFQSIPVIALILGLVAHVLATQFGVLSLEKFAEIPPTTHIAAAGIIIAGGLLLDLTEVEGKWSVDKKTIGLMLFASAVIAFISFTFKDAALEGNFVATAFYSGIGMTISGTLAFIFYAPYRKQFLSFCKEADKPTVFAQLGNEIVDTTAVMTSHVAVIIGPSVMAVSALNAWQPVFILIIGWIMAKRGSEAHVDLLDPAKFKRTGLAITLLAIGTVLIAL